MILSKLHKFVFLKGQKVAGTSVEIALSAICGPDDIITALVPIDERMRLDAGVRAAQNYTEDPAAEAEYLRLVRETPVEDLKGLRWPNGDYRNHMRYRTLRRRFGDLSDYTVFAIDRNPYSKVLSLANMQLSYGQYRTGGEMKGDEGRISKMVDRLIDTGGISRVRNLEMYLGRDGRLSAKVLRYENLQEELDGFMSEAGLPTIPPLPHAKKGIMANDRDPRDLLGRDQLDELNVIFADEFEAYGYERV